MANPLRGEVEMEIAGKSYTLRPTLGLLAEIESEFGGLLAFGRRLENSEWKVTEIVRLAHLLIKYQPGVPDEITLGNVMIRDGVFRYVPKLLAFLTLALTGEIPDAETKKATS